jgi:hypothetical protein
VTGEAGDDVPAAVAHLDLGVGGLGVIERNLLSSVVRRTYRWCVSVGVCAIGWRVSVDLP